MFWWFPNHKVIFVVTSNCNFATVMNSNAYIFGDRGLPMGQDSQVKNHWHRDGKKLLTPIPTPKIKATSNHNTKT